ERVEERVAKRTVHEMNRLPVKTDAVREQLPIAEVAGRHQDPRGADDSLRFAVPELRILESDALADVGVGQRVHVTPFGRHAAEVTARFAKDPEPLGCGPSRESESH